MIYNKCVVCNEQLYTNKSNIDHKLIYDPLYFCSRKRPHHTVSVYSEDDWSVSYYTYPDNNQTREKDIHCKEDHFAIFHFDGKFHFHKKDVINRRVIYSENSLVEINKYVLLLGS